MGQIWVVLQIGRNNYMYFTRVFNKGQHPAKLAGYSTWTCCLFDWEITSDMHFMTNVRNIRHKTRALDRPRFIHEKQKNLARILSTCNFSGDLCFLFCSNTPNSCSRMQEMHCKRPKFSNFWGEHTLWPPLEARVVHSSPSPKTLPPTCTQIPTENPVSQWGNKTFSTLHLNLPVFSFFQNSNRI